VIFLLLGIWAVLRLRTRARPAGVPSPLSPEEHARLDRLLDRDPAEDSERS
jgi:cytochrome c-type biogenesis protein CcmH/NrfF